jgi:hypothetical protein
MRKKEKEGKKKIYVRGLGQLLPDWDTNGADV